MIRACPALRKIWLCSVSLMLTPTLLCAAAAPAPASPGTTIASATKTTGIVGRAKLQLTRLITAHPRRVGVTTALVAAPVATVALQRLEGRLESAQAGKALALAMCLGVCAWLEAGRWRTAAEVAELKTSLSGTSTQLNATDQQAQRLLTGVAQVSAQLAQAGSTVATVRGEVTALQAVVAQQAQDLAIIKGVDAATQTELADSRELRAATRTLVDIESGRLTASLTAGLATQTAGVTDVTAQLATVQAQQQLLANLAHARGGRLQALVASTDTVAETVRAITDLTLTKPD